MYPTPIHPFHQGYILVLALVFLGIFSAVSVAYLSFITTSIHSAQNDIARTQALALAEAGVDEAIYQLNKNGTYSGETNVALGNGVFTVVISTINANTRRITATGSIPDIVHPVATRTVTMLATVDTTIVSFHYGVQVGAGGVTMSNGSKIIGNIFSNGTISGSGIVTGDATVASGTPATSLSGITVNGTARAHTLSSCTIGGDAFYQSLSGCSVAGTLHPGSVDTEAGTMPISDTQISNLETLATAGGVTAGPYTVSGTKTFGPQKIDGNLTVNGTLILSGVVWVKGDITFANNSTLTVSPTTGNDGAILIADVPGSETTKGIVMLSNNMTVSGNGSAGSYPMILSTNSGSAAITLSNNADSVILYASHGTVSVSNNAGANQITAYALSLKNNAIITYVTGLQNQGFSNGPGGSWVVTPGTYSLVR